MKYKNVVWDWNGTLLNDVKVGVNTSVSYTHLTLPTRTVV